MKTIDLVMISWPRDAARLEYLEKSLGSFRQYVTAARHKIDAYVSLETLDVSTENFLEAREICAKFAARPYWRNFPPSLGGNMNDALMLGHGDFKLLSQDDWVWNRYTNISYDCELLDAADHIALIRYATFYTEFGQLDHERFPGQAIWKDVKMDGPYPYGDQPHLRRGDFATRKSATGGKPVGFYDVGGPGDYATPENNMQAHLVENGWKIAAYNPNVVDHCGSLSSCPTRRG